MVLVCSAIRDLISPISRLTVSVETADDSPAGGVPTTGGVEARGDRSVVGVCNDGLALVTLSYATAFKQFLPEQEFVVWTRSDAMG